MEGNSATRLKRQFLEYLEIEKGRSSKTVENYSHYLERLFSYIVKESGIDENNLVVADITEDVVRRYRVWLNRQSNPLSVATQNYHVIALRMFLKYLVRESVAGLAPERVELAKHPRREVDFLEHDEVERLLKAPEGNSMRTKRDRAILETLYSTGLRVSELVALNIDSINLERGEFSVRGKGGKVRPVFLSERACISLKEWLSARQNVIDEALFVRIPRGKGKTFTRLTARSIQRMVQKYVIKAGIVGKEVHPHTLRHSFATDLLRNGADLRSVQALLGHSSITTTQVYTHVTDPQLKRVHEKFHRD